LCPSVLYAAQEVAVDPLHPQEKPVSRKLIGGLLALAAMLVPATAQTDSKPRAKEKFFKIGLYAGKVLSVDEDGKTFKLRVFGTTPVPRYTPGNPTS
jgi:hypothetical protein